MTKLGGARESRRRRDKLIKSGVKASVLAIVRPNGSCPAIEFLDEVKQGQFEARLEHLCATGRLRTPDLFRKLEVPGEPAVWEVKCDKGPGYRLYLVRVGNKFLATHGGKKPKANQVKAQVAMARTIFNEWEAS